MFRDKESSNRIELSRLVQDLLNFGILGSRQLWGGGRWVGVCVWLGGSMEGSGQITNNLINLDILEIIKFCLKIYDL